MPGSANGIDRWLVDRSGRVRPTRADRVLKTLSVSANYNRLWVGVAAALALLGGRAERRAAARGLVAVGLAGAIANGIAKPLFPRRRPPDESVPFVRRLMSPPVSSSFPSGHSASAAAFATAVAIESPTAAAVIVPVAAAVGYSRVHIGVHWPSDVVAGALLGTGLALATRRWWEVRTDEPAVLGPARWIDPVPYGNGLLLVTNSHSGGGDSTDLRALLTARLPEAEVLEVGPGDLEEQLAQRLRQNRTVALGAFGGDGTVSAVAEFAVRERLPLAVFAGGTLNHFARDAGVERIPQTLAALEKGEVVDLDAAAVQFDEHAARIFVNTASLGGYPDFVRIRERWERRIGKWPAAGLAMTSVLFRAQPVRASIDGARAAIWMLFVGNGKYHPAHRIPMSRPQLHDSDLDVRYLRADLPFSRTRLVWAAFTGTLDRSPTYVHRRADRLEVSVVGRPVSLATDGEVDYRGRDFTFTSLTGALALFRSSSEETD